MRYRSLLFMTLIAALVVLAGPRVALADEGPTLAEARAACLMDAYGNVLYEENADQEMALASITKIMTAMVALDSDVSLDDRITFQVREYQEDAQLTGYTEGETPTFRELMEVMLVFSGNDAANAAAIGISGSIDAFAALMNEKARQIGMTNSHFVTPSGLDEEEHYSTAHDMALLMAYALKNDDFAYLTSQTSMEVHFVYPADRFVTYTNHNKLLRLYDDCIGGKTGYTDQSGRCLVSAAKREGMTLIAVTLDDPDDWDDHIALYEYGFENYTAVTPTDEDHSIRVMGGTADDVKLYSNDTQPLVVPKKDGDSIKTQVFLPPFVYAPTEEGTVAGKVVYTINGSVIGESPLYYSESVAYDDRKRGFFEWLKDLLRIRNSWHS